MKPVFSRGRRAAAAIAMCVLVSVALTACSDDDDGGGAAPSPAARPSAASSQSATTPGAAEEATRTSTAPAAQSSLTITSEAFGEGGTIPATFTCSGDNTSPALSWSGAPVDTQSFALLVDDPDAPGGNFDHWVVYDLPASATALPPAIPEGVDIAGGGKQGVNGIGTNKYLGPCPPAGAPHHYQFRLFALDTVLELDPGSSKEAVETALQTHILADAELVGLFSR